VGTLHIGARAFRGPRSVFISAAASLETADSFAFTTAWNFAGLISDNGAVSSRLTLAILARGNVNLNVLMRNLNTKAWLGLVFLAFAMRLVLFVPAGAVQYWQAWIYLAVFFGASGLITFYLMRKDPALLERRLRGGPTAEKKKTQKTITACRLRSARTGACSCLQP
jgi:hypothetical protein